MGPIYRCPECDDEGDRAYFTTYFCPSEPDKCDGCEEDDDWLTCPSCGHREPYVDERDTAPLDEGLSWRQRRGDY